MTNSETRCPCGWPFPLNVTPIDVFTAEVHEAAFTRLQCPKCGDEHDFTTAEQEAAIALRRAEGGGE